MLNREVIQFCITQLRNLPEEQFDIASWGNLDSSHPLDVPEDPTCGFAGCFMGWAAHQQWFDQWGVRLRLGSLTPIIVNEEGVTVQTLKATYPVAKLMGIEPDTLDRIILPDNYEIHSRNVTSGMVADRLHLLLDMGEEEFNDHIDGVEPEPDEEDEYEFEDEDAEAEQQAEDEAKRELDAEIAEQAVEEEDRAEDEAKREDEQNGR